MDTRNFRRRTNSRRGFGLAVLLLGLTTLLGVLGLAFDMGRMYIVKNELQSFLDASVLGGVARLDGTKTGLQSAHAIATSGPLGNSVPNGWHFDSLPVTGAIDTYAATFNGAYDG